MDQPPKTRPRIPRIHVIDEYGALSEPGVPGLGAPPRPEPPMRYAGPSPFLNAMLNPSPVIRLNPFLDDSGEDAL